MANILTHDVHTNFLSGVLDPRVQGRVDTSAYTSSLITGTNVEISHLGGVFRRRGSAFCQVMPNQLTQLHGTYTVPNGATYYYAPDGNGAYQTSGAPSTPGVALGSSAWGYYLTQTTSTVGTTNPYVVVHVDLGSPQTVLFADVVGLSVSGGSSTGFAIQYSTDNSSWTNVTQFPQVDAGNGNSGYAYRATGPITARYWRVAKVTSTSLGSALVNLADFTLWADSGVVSKGRLISFEVSTGEEYAIVVTDRTGTVVAADGGATLQTIPLPYASADLPLLDAQSSAESLFMVHEGYAPLLVIRENSPLVLPQTSPNYALYYNFQAFSVVFDFIPQIDYADALSPTPTSDVQTLTFTSGWNIGDTFTITLLTDTTGPITYAGDNQTTANAIEIAVQALWAVNGFTGVSCISNGSFGYTLTFADAAAGNIGVLAITSLSSNATATAVENQVGVARQENVWSPNRGFPGTVTFFQGRLYFGGMRSQQESLVGSWVNNILNFETAQGLDDQAIYVTMSGVALNAVSGMFPGKSLCVLTTGGEFRFVNDQNQPIVPTSAPQNQTQYGSAHIKPVMVDGNIIFVQRNLNSIRDFQFDYTVDQFNSLGVSALCPNLVYDVQDMSAWQGALLEEINLVFVCNGTNPSTDFDALPNGSMSVYNTRKEVNVQAWVNWQTQGLYQNVCTVVDNILTLVQRNFNGTPVLLLEQPVAGTYTDCGVSFTNLNASAVSVSPALNGATVRCLGDGYVLDTQVVANGIVQLTSQGYPYVAKNAEVGLNFNPTVTPMPLQTVRWPAGSNMAHKKRVQAIRAKLRLTKGLLANGNYVQETQLDNFQMDTPTAPPAYTGIVELEESTNWDQTEDKMVTFTQVDPLPMQILFLDVTLSGEQ